MGAHRLLRVLRSSAGLSALALGSATAHAACTTSNGVVTCTGPTTTNEANSAIDATSPPSVSVVIASGATVAPANLNAISVSGFRFKGAIGYSNDGTVGVPAATVDFRYNGDINATANPANTLTISNRSVQNGSIFATNVGGAITAANIGTLTGSVDLRGFAAITLTNTGVIGGGFFNAITLNSALNTSQTGTDAITRSSQTGGPVIATIGGTVGTTSANNVFQPGSLNVGGAGPADVTVTGTTGSVSAFSGGSATDQGTTRVNANGVTTTTQLFDTRVGNADARVTVAASGRVTGISVNTAGGAATATVDGNVVATNGAGGNVGVTASGVDRVSRQVFTSTAQSSSQVSTQTITNRGGAALLDLTSSGRVAGPVSVSSNAASATARVAGQIGSATQSGSLSVTSAGTNSTSDSQSSPAPDFRNNVSSASTAALSGGAALATIASTGTVFGSVTVRGDASALIDNGGQVRGTSQAISRATVNTSSGNSSSYTAATAADGGRTTVDRNSSSFVFDTLGGGAAIINRTGATMNGVSGTALGPVTLDNSGTIQGSVFLSSSGSRQTGANANQTTTTTTPVSGGSVTTTLRESSGSNSVRATGGAVTATYLGTVGAPTRSGTTPFVSVQQNGTTTSAATVLGTLYGSYTGATSGQNSDSSNSSTTRQVTQSNGAYTRDMTSASSDASSYIRSSASLTVGSTGRIAAAGTGLGNVSLSAAGDTRLVVDGGRIDGSVVLFNDRTNTSSTSDTVASYTRAANNGNIFVPELLQSQVSNSSYANNATQGATVVSIENGGSIGGDISAQATGVGAGLAAVTVTVNGSVGGTVAATADQSDSRSQSTETITRTGPSSLARVFSSRSTQPPSTFGGDTNVTVAGTVGRGLEADAGAGSATVTLTGQTGIARADGVIVTASTDASQSDYAENSVSTDGFSYRTTGYRSSGTSTALGGTATLNVMASPALRAAGSSSIEGDVLIQGYTGSVLNIAAGSRIVQTVGGVLVGSTLTNESSTGTGTFADGVQTGSVDSTTYTAVGGPATITNAGVVGSAANRTLLAGGSVGGVTISNTGTVNGTVAASALGANQVTNTTATNLDNFTAARYVTTDAFTAVGGAAQVNNTALVTGDVVVAGATGRLTNAGVIRGKVTLGASASNYSQSSTTTTITGPSGPQQVTSDAPATANPTLFTQSYVLDQNGLLVGGVATTGTTTLDRTGAAVRTSTVNATINLNSGSITLGNIAGGAGTTTNVNLVGAGFLGIAVNDVPAMAPGALATTYRPTPAITRFTAIDPALGSTVLLPAGSRASGVQTLTKAGEGSFVIVGAPLLAATGTTPATYTLDVGTLRVNGGELQLGLAGTTATANSFGIGGTVENSAALVLGRRIANGTQTAIQGLNVAVLGNVTNAAAGDLVVGVNPAFVHNASGGLVAFSPALAPASTSSFVRIDGNLNLAGTVVVEGPGGGLYEAGRAYDLFSVSGAYTNTGIVRSSFASPFVGFTLTPRTEAGRTVVALAVTRTSFETAATDPNARAAAGALQATLPVVFGGIRSGAAGANVQDLANIVSALDTQLNAAQAAQLFRELSSGEFYGSLSAISTTAPFGEATDGLPAGDTAHGLGLWFRPTGVFATYRPNLAAGASGIDASNYGGSLGLDFATGEGGHVGIAGGYGRLKVHADTPERATADTYMAGLYAFQQLGRLQFSSQAVYGRSNWDAARTLSVLNRRATGSFKSEEIRTNLRVAYTVAMLPDFEIAPFAKVEARRYRFDGFNETGAGAVSLKVGGREKTVVMPELGVRMSGALGSTVQPFAQASYIFRDDVGSERNMGFTGGVQNFTVEGVDPGGAINAAIGVTAGLGRGTVFLRGDYASGGDQQVGSVRGGLLISF